MPKCIVIGKIEQLERKPKPIEFTQILSKEGELKSTKCQAADFMFIELICLKYGCIGDLMYAYDDPSKRFIGSFFVGNWNDGIAEIPK